MGRPPTINRLELLATARRVFAEKGFDAATLAGLMVIDVGLGGSTVYVTSNGTQSSRLEFLIPVK